MGPEQDRLAAADAGTAGWRQWGPYLAERAWGTVREDYGTDGNAWASVTHDQAASHAYRWNEEGFAGICDDKQRLNLALSLWNGRDPMLKERMFGLTNAEGNHGEDAKDYWWYLDSTPTHSWMRVRYHYPQAEFPYELLRRENASRSKDEGEYELLDTGIFDDDRYWVVTVDYAKAAPDDICMAIHVENAGPDSATLHVLPTLWFRNTWSWGTSDTKPALRAAGTAGVMAEHSRLGSYALCGDGDPVVLVCDNETNNEKLYGVANTSPYPKDGIGDHVIHGAATVNPAGVGTKAALWYRLDVPPGGQVTVRLRLAAGAAPDLGTSWDDTMAARQAEADGFYADLTPAERTPDEASVLRQALSSLLWSKQFYAYDVSRWLSGDPGQPPPPPGRGEIRNGTWQHLNNSDVLLMPDCWEYPWYAAWDLAFHAVAIAHVDPEFAKQQIVLLLREWYMHPSGQLPAYEWNFSDVNPPVHAWAALRIFEIDGSRDHSFLERVFHKLLMNFTWWVNRKDVDGNDVFAGGFLGLDNIGAFDRSTLPPWRHPGAERRHGLDGDVQPRPAGDGARAHPCRARVRRRRHEVLRALLLHLDGHPRRRAVGLRGRVLL